MVERIIFLLVMGQCEKCIVKGEKRREDIENV